MAVSRWRKELEVQQSLEHPAVPAVIAVFEDEKAFVVEWGDGLGLDDLIERRLSGNVALQTGSVLRIGMAILDALNALQEAGHNHGNLSPDKLRLRPSGEPQIYGWGTRPERIHPRYMAPEMTGSGDVGPHTDQWMVAVMLFELSMGRPLFRGEWSEVFRMALDGDTGEACAALSAEYPALSDALLPALRSPTVQPYAGHSEMLSALSSALLAVGAGPTLPMLLATLEGDASSSADLSTEDAELIELDPEPLSESEEGSAVEEAPQLERVEIKLPEPALLPEAQQDEAAPELGDGAPQEVQAEASLAESEQVAPSAHGPLGVEMTAWEKAELESCQGADPVERGSWWVARGGEQTRLPEGAASERVEPEEEVHEEVVALPEPEAALALDSEPEPSEEAPESVRVAHPYPEIEPPAEVLFQETAKEDDVQPPILEDLPPVPQHAPVSIQMPPMERLSLPGLEAVSQALSEEEEEGTPEALPWSQPEVVIPAPPKPLEVEPPPANIPAILSPRRPVVRDRSESHQWEQAWGTRPLSERIARGSLLVLAGMGLAWLVMG